MLNRIRPFNHDIIINEINPNDKSDIFVFFLEHGTLGFLGDEYRYFIDELIQIPFFHFYIMNDSCFSGSLVEIIKASYDFENIVKNRFDSALEYTFIKLLFTYGNFDSEILLKQSLNQIINNVLKNQGLENNFITIFKDIYKNEILNLLKFGKKFPKFSLLEFYLLPKISCNSLKRQLFFHHQIIKIFHLHSLQKEYQFYLMIITESVEVFFRQFLSNRY